jgi:pimeloyl-ACP methyl ester carboxylesterase
MTSDALLEALSDAVHAAELAPPRILLPDDHLVHLNGVRFHYLDWGNPHLPHVVLLHGDGLQAHTWDLAALLLRDRYHLVALSLRGHGDSGWSADGELARDPFDLLLDDTRAFIEHLNYDKLTLVGMSLGGLTAYRFAAHYPERLTALVILDAAPELDAAGLAELARQRSAAEVLAHFDDFLCATRRFLPNRSPAQLRYSLLHALKQLPDGRWTWKRDPRPTPQLGSAARAARTAALWQDVHAIRTPTLLLRGEHSPLLSVELACRVEREMRDARLVTIPGAGHNLHGDAPAAFARALDAFLSPRT